MPLTPLGLMSRCSYADPSYAAGEQMAFYTGRYQRSEGVEPVVYLHGPNVDASTSQAARFQETFNAIAANAYPVLVPETGSTSQWATTDTVGASGFIDDMLDYANQASTGSAQTRKDKVGLYGYLNGALNAINWAWRNPGKVRSVVLLAPIVDPGAFYTANPTWQASIDADWGSHGAFTTALPTIDPMQNLDLIRPFAHRILCVYSPDDEYVDPDGVLAFAELVGAETLEVSGLSAIVANTAAEASAMWTLRKMRERSSAYVAWDEHDWERYTQVAATVDAPLNTFSLLTTDSYGAGRRGEWRRTAGVQGNERYGYLLDEVSAPDVAVKTIWWNDNGQLVGQPGNIMRGRVDPATDDFLFYIAWADITFRIPWWVNRGKWSGPVGGPNGGLVLTQVESGVIPGLRLNAGGDVLASSRQGNTVTITVLEADADRNFRSGTLDVILPGIANFTGFGATRVDANHIRYTQAGGDVPSGGPGSWADFASGYPYNAETMLVGGTMQGRFWPLDIDPPDWGDPDWTFTWVESGSPSWAGYGNPGQMAGHVGITFSDNPHRLQFGPAEYQEL